MVIDLFGLSSEQVRERYPKVYQHLLETVKPERDTNNRASYRDAWWIFGEPRKDLRPALEGLPRYIATVETAKHRVFQFLDAEILPDNMIVAIASDDAFHLGVLSSSPHVAWAPRSGGWLGVGNDPRYSKSRCFDPFPFPDPDESSKAEIARIAELLDAHRKRVQAEHPDITLTEMYNVLEKLKSRAALTAREEDIKSRALILILRELHDELDAAVLAAYGWPQTLSTDDILARLVALNAQRATEEAAGHVRWLRPDYQLARFGSATQQAQKGELDLVAPADKAKPSFPTDERRRTAAIFSSLASTPGPVTAGAIAARFRQGKKVEKDIALTLRAFVRFGDLSSSDGGTTFQLRQAA